NMVYEGGKTCRIELSSVGITRYNLGAMTVKKRHSARSSHVENKALAPASAKRQFQQRLSQWYRHHGRDLPWRRTTDPYAILVSEVMLQQTQVERVLEYYRRFLARFPTVAALAAASVDDVLAAWQGLGYYRRARNLHLAAQQIMERHHGVFPDTFDEAPPLPRVQRSTPAPLLCF